MQIDPMSHGQRHAEGWDEHGKSQPQRVGCSSNVTIERVRCQIRRQNQQQCLDLLDYTWLYEKVCVENEFRIGWRRCLGVEPSLDQTHRATVVSPACT